MFVCQPPSLMAKVSGFYHRVMSSIPAQNTEVSHIIQCKLTNVHASVTENERRRDQGRRKTKRKEESEERKDRRVGD